jgi:Ca2+-binding RTX toxin-like protein
MTYIVGTPAADRLDGSAGDDLIEGLGNEDWIEGKDGADTLLGGEGDDYLAGGAGNDSLSGGGGDDYLDGGDGDDVMLVGKGMHTIYGGAGDDRVEIHGGEIIYDTGIWGWMGDGIDDVVLDYSDYRENLFVDWSDSDILYVLGGVNGGSVMVTIREVERMSSVTTGIGDDTVFMISPDGIARTGAGDDHVLSVQYKGGPWATLGGSADGGAGIDRARLNWSDLGPGQNVVYDTAHPEGTTVATESGDRFLRGFEVLEDSTAARARTG